MPTQPNRLIHEKSPYLLQQRTQPVDWYPWGEEAFERARREKKPIFLSIGYSTCHWCHVMARESFESEEIGKSPERALHPDQGGSGRTPRCGQGVHDLRPGHHRRGRLADERVADP